jgi:hypothetical protein
MDVDNSERERNERRMNRKEARREKKIEFRKVVQAARTTIIEDSADDPDPDQTPTQKQKGSPMNE